MGASENGTLSLTSTAAGSKGQCHFVSQQFSLCITAPKLCFCTSSINIVVYGIFLQTIFKGWSFPFFCVHSCTLQKAFNNKVSTQFYSISLNWGRLQLPGALLVISPDFSRDISRFFPRIDRIFPGEALNSFYGAQDEGFSEFRSR